MKRKTKEKCKKLKKKKKTTENVTHFCSKHHRASIHDGESLELACEIP